MSDNQQVGLRVLGRQVMAQIELKQSQCLLEAANKQLLQQSLTDPLIGLENRRSFERLLHSEFQRAACSDTPVSLLILDIDFFKSFNDTYGHVQGDDVLRQVASLVRAAARTTDYTARFGKDEFAVILANTSSDQAFQVATRICAAISSESWTVRPITVSVGVTTRNAEMQEPDALIIAADKALYQAKRSGKNCVRSFAMR